MGWKTPPQTFYELEDAIAYARNCLEENYKVVIDRERLQSSTLLYRVSAEPDPILKRYEDYKPARKG